MHSDRGELRKRGEKRYLYQNVESIKNGTVGILICEENFKAIQLYTGERKGEDCFSNETVINSAGDCCDFNVCIQILFS